MTLEHQLIRASAGTGKTFRLTNRFLELLDAGAEPGTILATTFTRKAAGEIRDRILDRLAAATEREEDLEELRVHVRSTMTAEDCVRLLARIARHLHRLNVRTLDAFFLRAASAFQLELDAPPGWRIASEDETAALRRGAIDDALAGGDAAELFALLTLLFEGDAKYTVHDQLARAVSDAYDLWRRTENPEAWEHVQPVGRALDGAGQAGIEARIVDMPLALTKSGEPDKRWVKQRDDLLDCVRSGADADRLLGNGLVKCVASGNGSYYKHELEPHARTTVERLVEHAEAIIIERIARRNVAFRELLGHFHAAYEARKRRAATFNFDDVPLLLLHADASARLDALYYRLDAVCRHLLLDEFQDTSNVQFRLLEPLVDEVLAAGPPDRSFFCVGDEKQSLYGWRNADPELLPSLPGRWPGRMETEELERSFRSSPVVLGAVNEVFGGLRDNRVLAPYEHTCELWNGFRTHESARAALGGAARVIVARPQPRGAGTESDQDARVRTAVERVQAALAEAPHASIGVLVRKTKDISRLVLALQEAGVNAAREGGSTLLDAPAVAAAVAALVFADHPDHGVARYHVAASPLGPLLGVTDPRDAAAARGAARRIRVRCADEGHAQVLASWQRACAAAMDARDARRFGQLIALAEECEDTVGLRPSRLARIVRERRVPEPEVAAVRVMTIHASKGLEFDAVVLPQLDERWSVRNQVVHRADANGVTVAVSYKPADGVRQLSAELTALYDDCAQRQFSEELCCLYVAMTRARHVLDMIVLPPKKSRSAAATPKPAELLIEAFGIDTDRADDIWWETSAGDWAGDVARNQARAVALPVPEPVRFAIRPPDRARLDRAARRSPSGLEGGRRLDLGQRLRILAPDARRRGAVMHAWFAAVEWLDAGVPGNDVLDALARREGATAAESARWRNEFHRALRRDGVSATLTRPHRGDVRVQRERRFAVRDVDERDGAPVLLSGAFDRVVIEPPTGVPTAITIVDFKTDAVTDENAGERIEHYRPQMDAYRRAAARLWAVDAGQIAVKLLFTETGAVVDM